jgi:hypothetical protein
MFLEACQRLAHERHLHRRQYADLCITPNARRSYRRRAQRIGERMSAVVIARSFGVKLEHIANAFGCSKQSVSYLYKTGMNYVLASHRSKTRRRTLMDTKDAPKARQQTGKDVMSNVLSELGEAAEGRRLRLQQVHREPGPSAGA